MHPLRVTRKPIPVAAVHLEVERLVDRLVHLLNPRAIYLFGSAARGEMTDQSDLDLLILGRDQNDIKAMRKLLRPHLPLSKYSVDFVWMSVQDFQSRSKIGGLAMVASEEGKCVYFAPGESHG